MSIGRALPLMKGMNARPVPPSQDRGKQHRDGRQRRAGPSSNFFRAGGIYSHVISVCDTASAEG